MRSTPWITASVLALILGPVPLSAQQTGTIVGSVLDATSQRPLQSAQLFIPGTSVGAVTSEAGLFILLNVPAGTHTLRTILIGYGEGNQTVTVTAGGTAEIAIQLQPTTVALEGLVVTALGLERQARTLGVAAQQIDDDVLSPVAPSVVSSLSGQVAGVTSRLRPPRVAPAASSCEGRTRCSVTTSRSSCSTASHSTTTSGWASRGSWRVRAATTTGR